MKIHIETVNKNVKYSYNQCVEQTVQLNYLKNHNETVHEKVKYLNKSTIQESLKTRIETVYENPVPMQSTIYVKLKHKEKGKNHVKSVFKKVK